MSSGFFTCTTTPKKVIRPAKNLRADSACVVLLQCEPNANTTFKPSSGLLKCAMVNGACEDTVACAKRDHQLRQNGGLPFTRLEVASQSSSTGAGDLCWYEGKQAQRNAVEFTEAGAAKEFACVSSYSCKRDPAKKLVACTSVKEGAKDVCPQVNDCLGKPLPIAEAYTRVELDDMVPAKRAAAIKDMEDGPEPTDITAVSTIHADPMTAEVEVHP